MHNTSMTIWHYSESSGIPSLIDHINSNEQDQRMGGCEAPDWWKLVGEGGPHFASHP